MATTFTVGKPAASRLADLAPARIGVEKATQ
jgi:hypothetical protein